MNRIKKVVMSFLVIVTLFGIGFYYNQKTISNPVAAAPLPGYSDIKTAPNINIVGATGSDTEIDGDYGFMFKLTPYVSYTPIGDPIIDNGYNGSETKVYRYSPNMVGEQGAWIRNAGLYNGRSVDLKFVIDKLDFQKKANGTYPYFRFFAVANSEKTATTNLPSGDGENWNVFYLMVGSGDSSHWENFHRGDKATYHYEFYDHETGNQLDLKGAWNFNNINVFKKASIPYADTTYKSMFVRDISEIGYKTETGYFEMTSDSFEVNKPSGRLTHLFNQQQYNVGMEYHGQDYSDPKDIYGPMGIMYSTESIARIAPATPIVYGQKNSATHTNGEYKKIKYSILQSIADNTKENRDTTFKLNTEVPSSYDIESIKVYEYGSSTEIGSSLFNITMTGSKAVLTAIDSTSDAFNGKVLDIKVVAKPNATFIFDKTDYRYQTGGLDDSHMIFELGELTNTHYTYKNLSIDKTLPSKPIKDQSEAKVLYEGVPDADPKMGLTFPKGTDFSLVDKQTAYLENIRVDTGNPIDQPVTVSYKNGTLPNSTTLGKQNVTLVLTTAKGITTEKTVEITITETVSTLVVEFVNELGTTLNPPVTKQKNIGEHVDVSADPDVIRIIDEIKAKNYELPIRPANETNFVIVDGENKIRYVFTGQLTLKSAPSLMDFGIEEATNYKKTRVEEPQIDQPLVVSDSRGILKSWTLSAKLLKPLASMDDSSYVLPDAIIYNNGTKDIPIQAVSTDIVVQKHTNVGDYNISNNWSKNGSGFKVEIPAGAVNKLGKYRATLEFTLADTK